MRKSSRRLLPFFGMLMLLTRGTPAAAEPPAFKIYVEREGAYRVGFEDLTAAGLEADAVPSDGLGLTHRGEPVPIWVEDAGDGRFEPGDWFELVGERLAGEGSYFNEHSRYNVYRLSLDAAGPARMELRRGSVAAGTAAPPGGKGGRTAAPPGGRGGRTAALRREQHLEEDLLLIRLPATPPNTQRTGRPAYQERWFWEKLVLGHEPAVRGIDLGDLDRHSEGSVELRIELRGWSLPRRKDDAAIPDHRVDVALNGRRLRTAEWDGREPYLLELSGLGAEDFVQGENRLTLGVPKRQQADGNPLIDVVLLNWIEISYPRDSRVGVSPADRLRAPDRVILDRPSRWTGADNRADYVMIVHRRFLEAVLPLAELHRRRGLDVAVVDVEDVFDEMNHGIPHPRALRDFLAQAYHHWARPAPRFVLLVGDASWDSRNEAAVDENYADWTARPGEVERFTKNRSTPYPRDGDRNHRQYVPTSIYETFEGHAASDNAFVLVDGDDELPDLAIGRFPVAEPSEAAEIVAKTVRYAERPESGPWRRRALFITNEKPGFQRRSDRVAEKASAAGYLPSKIYPAAAESSNELHTERLIAAFDDGALLIHFLGHGGRYIWRTGPPDLEKNHDLFTLDHLDRLRPTGRLPVVLSLTCYSAPFDHPSADSIGEKLLRIPGRGAVAVVAASWRNSPRVEWGETLFEELTAPGATVGEALMRAKRRLGHPLFVHTYNLLGDPALPVALPEVPKTSSD